MAEPWLMLNVLSIVIRMLIIGPRLLLPSGASLHLHIAARDGDTRTVETLLNAGLDVNTIVWGNTLLHNAAWNGHAETAELLVKFGAAIHATNWVGNTPLDDAIVRRHTPIVKLLAKAGANVHAQATAQGVRCPCLYYHLCSQDFAVR